jgi:hypothetical protein
MQPNMGFGAVQSFSGTPALIDKGSLVRLRAIGRIANELPQSPPVRHARICWSNPVRVAPYDPYHHQCWLRFLCQHQLLVRTFYDLGEPWFLVT